MCVQCVGVCAGRFVAIRRGTLLVIHRKGSHLTYSSSEALAASPAKPRALTRSGRWKAQDGRARRPM